MAARLNPRNDDTARQKIQVTQLINRLQNHACSKGEMSPSQIQAATTLLDRALPRLQATEIDATMHQGERILSDAELMQIAAGNDADAGSDDDSPDLAETA